ncbi:MAG: type I DNA topoisomerase [Patescibacteria group bacterium]|nr:type I DNA topoisomerase [Patescibacteria group bacterium]
MQLIIVESPKKAVTIKKFLGKSVITLASYGHIIDLPKKNFGLYLKENKLEYRYQIINWPFIKKLKSSLKNFNEIYLATDPDREGEFIAWSISQYLKKKKIYRIRFYEISKQALSKALNQKDKINLNLVEAQKGRRFLDRIVGYTLSPILWRDKIGRSAGRVQSAALRLIVDREEEINKFKPEIYYQLEVNFGQFKAYLLNGKKNYFEKDQYEYLKNLERNLKNKKFFLKKIDKKEKIIFKPTPLDTALLQRISFLKHHFSSSSTMFLAQNLYEKGIITYHRTDSFNLSQEFLKKIKDFLQDEYSPPRKGKKGFSQEAHEAIRPVYLKKDLNLTPQEKKIYELIFDHTLAACSLNAIVEKINYFISPEKNDNLIFQAGGENLIREGFLKNYPFKMSFKNLPPLQEGEILFPRKLNLIEKQTKPPSPYTESTLIKKLKDLGIGRPSTYAEIIKTLLKRKYIEKVKNYLKPTERGIKVIDFLKKVYPEIIDLNFTAEMEKKLDQIAQGELNYEKYLIHFWQELKSKL